jgi:ribosomal protein S18 acetylase RimI-like enzyme
MDLLVADDSEIEEIAELVNASYRGEGGWTNEIGNVEGLRTNPCALRVDLAGEPNACLLVGRGEPMGLIQCCVWLAPSDRGKWYLGLLSVHPRSQDQKLGRTVLAEAEGYARARGARGIRLTVVNVRDSLIAWYQRRGYRLTGETEPFPYHDNRFGAPLRDDLCFVVLEKMFDECS